MNKITMSRHVEEKLKQARETYGNKNQILVCMEELNELATVLAKYPRYADESKATAELYDRVLDETADVVTILNHVINIFGITDKDLDERIEKKVARLERWLSHSDNMQETIDDRAVESGNSSCEGCIREKVRQDNEYESTCRLCKMAQATEGILPFYVR